MKVNRIKVGARIVNTLLIVVSILIALGAIEGLVRIFVDERYWRFTDATDDWVIDKEIGWRQKANLNSWKIVSGKKIYFQTNEDGFQIEGRLDAPTRIVIIGDSTVVGRAVSKEERVHVQIYKKWRARSDFDVLVVNAGVQGYSTDQSLLMLQSLIKKYKPRFVLHSICENDLLQNQTSLAYVQMKPHFIMVKDKLELKKLATIPKEISLPDYPLIYRLVQSSAIYRMLQPFIVTFREQHNLIRNSPKSDDIYKNFNDYAKQVDWDLFSSLLAKMNEISNENGAKFFLYKHPGLEEVWLPYRTAVGISPSDAYAFEGKVKQIAQDKSLKYVEMISYFLQNQDKGPFHLLPRDPHTNGKGYELQADVLVSAILGDRL